MKVTIMQDGKTVSVDGNTYYDLDFTLASDVHCVHWDSESSTGEVEYNDGKSHAQITSIGDYQVALDKYNLAKTEEDNRIEQEEVDFNNLKQTYDFKRQQEYPTIEDQLDDIYHNGIDGWKTTIKAIKDKYPKE
jgi:hypothetical protein